MGHVPHVYLAGPWPQQTIPLPGAARHHLETVLRARPGEAVTYTDGAGTLGTGTLSEGGVVRGTERTAPAAVPRVTLAVAPPRRAERARFVVEKLAELGVDRLVWLASRHGSSRPPRPEKAAAWAAAALEQSRGAWLLDVVDGIAPLSDLPLGPDQPLWVAEPTANLLPSVVESGELIVAIGPEAGLTPEEIPPGADRFGLGHRILRVETAAIAAAVLVLARVGRMGGCQGTAEEEKRP